MGNGSDYWTVGTHKHTYTHTYSLMHVYMYIHTCTNTYGHTYPNVYTDVHLYKHTYTHTNFPFSTITPSHVNVHRRKDEKTVTLDFRVWSPEELSTTNTDRRVVVFPDDRLVENGVIRTTPRELIPFNQTHDRLYFLGTESFDLRSL